MSRPAPPTITVCCGDWQRTFAATDHVVIGRDLHADVRVPNPLVSSAHVLLRCQNGRWVAIDNESRNGIFVEHRRVHSVDIRDGETIHIGTPEGPRLTFELGPISRLREERKVPVRPVPRPEDPPPARMKKEAGRTTDAVSNIAATLMRVRWMGASVAAPPGSTTIGRAPDSDILVPDVLASRHHAMLVPTPHGVRIQDANSINGTFVNGERVKDAVLRENDVVTIGNFDLVFANGKLVRRTEPAAKTGGLEVRGVSLTLERGITLLDRVSFSARPGTLTAVIGPSGSGKSTLSRVIAGTARPTSGTVSFEGHNLHAEYASLRSRIGMVPQDDVVHRQLTINQGLRFAAELRMPPDTTKRDRLHVIAQVLEELELTPHAETRVGQLSGGQRKRASVALELLTGPSLLVLDEPTSGLDPALDRQVMTMLRQLADAGRVIVVVTHSLTFLDVCDQVLLLAPGGKTAFCGPPGEIGPTMGSTDWADIFTDVGADPGGAQQRFLQRAEHLVETRVQAAPGQPPEKPTEKPTDLGEPVHTSLWRQFSTIARRQVQLIVADRGYFLFLVLLPLIVGLLPLAVAGHAGFGKPPVGSVSPNEPKQILTLLSFGAVFMGIALTVRELVGERAIFRREQAVGLSATAYLFAKVGVFGTAAVIQSALLVVLVTAPKIGKHAPSGAAALGSPMVELFVDIAATCVVAAILGLCVSALAHTSNQVLPLMVVTLMAQLVLAGGMIPVTDRLLLDPFSWLTPARWGLAALASTADLPNLVSTVPKDSHWKHTASAWSFDIAMLAVLALVYAGFVRWKIRLNGAGR
jgi:ABC-type multidrug transport system ATPase subunit